MSVSNFGGVGSASTTSYAQYYALVICNHTSPRPGEGCGIAVEVSGALTKVLPWQCRGNTQGLLYIGKKGHEMKAGENSSGFTNEQSPQGGAFTKF